MWGGIGGVHVLICFHYSCPGKLGQGLTSVIHQVEEGLGFTDSEGAASQGSGRGQGEREEHGQDSDTKTKPEGEQPGTTGNGVFSHATLHYRHYFIL